MRKINRIVHKDIALRFLRGCGVPQFVDRVTKLVSDCLDQINEFYDVLSTVEDGKDGKDGEQGPMGPVGPAGPIGPKGNDGIGVPSGGNVGQYLKKKSNSNYDTEWSDIQVSSDVTSVNGKTGDVVLSASDVDALPSNTPLFSGSYNDLTDKPTIPTALSQLSEDTTHRTVSDTEKTTWNNKSNFSGSYNDLTDKPTIPAEQVQSDWNQTDNSSKDFIKNKPTIPTIPSNLAYTSNDDGEGIIPSDGIRAVTVTSAATMTISPDVVTVINGAVGTAAITLQVPNDNLAHVWDIIMTTDSTVAITFAMSNSATILYPDGFSVGASKAVEISVIGVGTKYYLRYGEFA